ncbi:hypothetical protein FJQ98_10175 [Lysinibacillus agricola]|uniref:Uncharacterized protein n=1 Tax=Lysinibacillus agricola TaxID=2590012 RepID=A0ABX7B1P4_9BACI|nr:MULTISPECIES: hypothetical protein [Lysinibacillus]KOS64230.1 hypothetical protein AN161_03320 [Lysinibacillus sp. FJAT-14222]QQP14344.1 hypothetical protein FJQ98_10175 [Lysinibacillus agricola]
MRIISYAFILLIILLIPYFLLYHQLPSELLQVAAIITGMHIIALFIVNFTHPQSRKTICMYQTLFSILLFAPVFYTMTVLLHNPQKEIIIRFFIAIPISYVILFLTVLFSTTFYKFKDSTK